MELVYYVLAGLGCMAAGAFLWALLDISGREQLKAEAEERTIDLEREIKEVVSEREQSRETEELHGGSVLVPRAQWQAAQELAEAAVELADQVGMPGSLARRVLGREVKHVPE